MAENIQLCNLRNHELYSKPSFPAPQLYLLGHTLTNSVIFLLSVFSEKNKLKSLNYTYCDLDFSSELLCN